MYMYMCARVCAHLCVFVYVCLYMCVYVCPCVCACVHVWVHTAVYKLAETQKSIQSTVLYSSSSYFLTQVLSQNLELSVPAGLATQQVPSYLQISTPPPSTGVRHTQSGFYVRSGNLNSSGPHAYSASMRLTEQSWVPLPSIFQLFCHSIDSS